MCQCNNFQRHESVVLYSTSLGVFRNSFKACIRVRNILSTLGIQYQDRDLSVDENYKYELEKRMHRTHIKLPQLFAHGNYIGDAEIIEELNETGELCKILK